MIGERLKKLRLEQNMSQTDLGKAVFGDELKTDNAAQVKIARLEANKQEPTSSELAKIADYFKVPMCGLLDEPLRCIFKGAHLDDQFIKTIEKVKIIHNCPDQSIKDMFINGLHQIALMAEAAAINLSQAGKISQMESEIERLHNEIVDLRRKLGAREEKEEAQSVKNAI